MQVKATVETVNDTLNDIKYLQTLKMPTLSDLKKAIKYQDNLKSNDDNIILF